MRSDWGLIRPGSALLPPARHQPRAPANHRGLGAPEVRPRRPAEPGPIVVPYLLAVTFFIMHVFEEYLTGFWVAMSELTGQDIPEFNFMLVAAFIGPTLWLTGLILFYLKTELGNYLVWAFIVAMTVSELAHFVFPFMAEGRFTYFPGLYTAVLPLIPALVCAVRLVRGSRHGGAEFSQLRGSPARRAAR